MILKHSASSGCSTSTSKPAVQCGGAVKVIACIQNPAVIGKILTHLTEPPAAPAPLPHSRAPPQAALFE